MKINKTITRTMLCAMAGISVIPIASAYCMLDSYANTNSNYDLRKKVIGLSGIMMITGDTSAVVSRAEFARMLVLASPYRSVLTNKSNTSVFNDVKSGSEYASAIRIAAENGWMTGYLGGNFRPDQNVTLGEAVKGILYVLGYTSSDFEGDQANKRMAKYAYLGLDDNMGGKTSSDSMTRLDCINIFYNMLKCKKANSNTDYITEFDGSLNSDGEVNALAMADKSLKGPKLASNSSELKSAVPFDLDDANIFVNGVGVTVTDLKSRVDGSGYVIIYYSPSAKTIWAYDSNEDSDTGKAALRGVVQNIYYQSSNTLTPSKVEFEDGTTFNIDTTDMQFAFSIYGDVKVGDEVVIIYDISKNSDDDATRTVVDYVKD